MSFLFKTKLSLIVISLGATSCATIFTNTTARITISSRPENAELFLNGNYVGVTPYTGSFRRDRDYNITVKKDGYNNGTAVAMRHFNPVSILNTVVFPFWIVDIGTGAIWEFDDERIVVPLKRSNTD